MTWILAYVAVWALSVTGLPRGGMNRHYNQYISMQQAGQNATAPSSMGRNSMGRDSISRDSMSSDARGPQHNWVAVGGGLTKTVGGGSGVDPLINDLVPIETFLAKSQDMALYLKLLTDNRMLFALSQSRDITGLFPTNQAILDSGIMGMEPDVQKELLQYTLIPGEVIKLVERDEDIVHAETWGQETISITKQQSSTRSDPIYMINNAIVIEPPYNGIEIWNGIVYKTKGLIMPQKANQNHNISSQAVYSRTQDPYQAYHTNATYGVPTPGTQRTSPFDLQKTEDKSLPGTNFLEHYYGNQAPQANTNQPKQAANIRPLGIL